MAKCYRIRDGRTWALALDRFGFQSKLWHLLNFRDFPSLSEPQFSLLQNGNNDTFPRCTDSVFYKHSSIEEAIEDVIEGWEEAAFTFSRAFTEESSWLGPEWWTGCFLWLLLFTSFFVTVTKHGSLLPVFAVTIAIQILFNQSLWQDRLVLWLVKSHSLK